MSGKLGFRWWAIVAACWAACGSASAAPPWGELVSLKSVDADPNKVYTLNEENGPWMIMACSFSGEGASKQAQELVYELRKRYKLPAYTYEGHFDPGEAQGTGGRGVDQFGRPRKWNYAKYKDSKDREKARHPQLVEVAVLVGNYPSNDDPELQKTLQKIKYATPQCLEVKDGKQTNQTLVGWRMLQRQVYEAIGSEKKKNGPMGHAFATISPALPPEYFARRNGLDELVLALNEGVPHSLLDCPGKVTVQVATFKGQVIIKQDEIKAIQNGEKEMHGELAEAAQKADKLTRALRIKGYEAYQFHDHNASIVTVGSFDSAGTPCQDGHTEIDPEIHRIMKTFGAESKTVPGQAVPITPLKTLVGIPFDIQPLPVHVPKRPISMAMRNRE
jgi:hypothetical protein